MVDLGTLQSLAHQEVGLKIPIKQFFSSQLN